MQLKLMPSSLGWVMISSVHQLLNKESEIGCSQSKSQLRAQEKRVSKLHGRSARGFCRHRKGGGHRCERERISSLALALLFSSSPETLWDSWQLGGL